MTNSIAQDGYYIGIDVGGTNIRAARFTPDLVMQQHSKTLSLPKEGQEAVLNRIVEQARAVWPTDGKPVLGIGASAPGGVNPEIGKVIFAPNLYWRDVPLRDRLQTTFNVPTYIGNDANLATLAETTLGAARGYKDVLFLTISTGIGGGVITNGRLLVGAEGLGTEVGHTILVVDNGQISSLEKEAAGPAIERQAKAALKAGEKSKILDLAGGSIDAVTTPMVTQAAQEGDALGLRLITRAGFMVGLGIVNFLLLFNPRIVILGGSVAEHTGDMFMNPLWQAIRENAISPLYWNNLVIARAQLGDSVSLVGAAALALHKGGQ